MPQSMTTTSFCADLDRDDFALLLEARFQFLQTADLETMSGIDASLGKLPARGQPINTSALRLFELASLEHQRGATLETAIERAMEQFPDVKPRRRRKKKVAGHTDPDHDKLILLAEYKRYRSLITAGLDPAIAYSTNNFFEFILTRQWQLAAAVFSKSNKQRRAKLCEHLNQIGLKKPE